MCPDQSVTHVSDCTVRDNASDPSKHVSNDCEHGSLDAEAVLVEQKDVLGLGRETHRLTRSNRGQPALLERDLRTALGLQIDVGHAAQLLDHLDLRANAL